MWMNLRQMLACPTCQGPLDLDVFNTEQVAIDPGLAEAVAEHDSEEGFGIFVESGLLNCDACRVAYPIWRGLPILLTFTTSVHREFAKAFAQRIGQRDRSYPFPNGTPESGEADVMASFSREWLEYKYDGVIWELSYEDHETRFLKEIGFEDQPVKVERFVEIGCGIGITTYLAQKAFGATAVGVDLSLAALSATQHYKSNPFLHFVQASAFHLPVRKASFDMVYSRGVLHHTFSTEKAFRSIAPICRSGGLTYLWVYGPRSIRDNPLRRMLYLMEIALRPAFSRGADTLVTKLALSPIALFYIMFNAVRRTRDRAIQPLDFARALHAARDRFTPRFAHRHDAEEVSSWFRETGFEDIVVVDWRSMPTADHDDYRRNTGVRGLRNAHARN